MNESTLIANALNAEALQEAEHGMESGPGKMRIDAQCLDVIGEVIAEDDAARLPPLIQRLRENGEQIGMAATIAQQAELIRLHIARIEGLSTQLAERDALVWGVLGASGKKRAEYLTKLQALLSGGAEPADGEVKP